MLIVALRDLQYRLRRFVISVLAVALVFSLSLVLTGVSISFDTEITRTLDQLDTDVYVVPTVASGPFFATAPMLQGRAEEIAALPGVQQVAAAGFRPMTIDTPSRRGVNAFGLPTDGWTWPPLVAGTRPSADGQAVVDKRAKLTVGQTFNLNGKPFTVSGLTENSTLLAGGPNVFISLKDMQALAFGGQPIITAVLVKGQPQGLPPDLHVLTRSDAQADLLEPIKDARSTIYMVMGLLWIVAAAIVGSVVYLSATERMAEFAVFKAIGISSRGVVAGLVLQSAILALVSVVVAVALGFLLAPVFPIPVDIPPAAVGALAVAGLVIGGLASIAAVRKALSVDPALAFG